MSILKVSKGERALTAELIFAMMMVFVAQVRKKGALPSPENFVGLVIVYSFLGIMSAFGDKAARLAGAFGFLVLLALLIRNIGGVAGIFSATTNPVHLDNQTTPSTSNATYVTTAPSGQLYVNPQTGSPVI